jgi:ribosome maturation factor RimP
MWGRFPTFFCSWGVSRRDVNDALEGVVTAELDSLGFELVEFRKGGTKRRPVLDVRIDRRDGAAVTVDDCAKVSRAIEAKLDGSDLVSETYVLEVGSPGIERPLRTAAEFRRFVGKHASVLSDALGGREEVEIVGVEGEPGAEVVSVRVKPGDVRQIPLSEVREARLVFRW